MKIVINGIHANLRFSSAHMIPCHQFCGGIHGHSYHVDVQVDGDRCGEFGFVVDFKKVKDLMRDLCSDLDHKVLIPLESDDIKFNDLDDSVDFSIGVKKYTLPREDCCLLSLKSTCAEELAEYFARKLYNSLKEEENESEMKIASVQVCVNEGIGQGAYFEIKD
ncbi:MAG: 6-carboxytetrahydropterin synthase [Methanobacterium sp.]|nr:6-carboxytetrahydropterin synthase [Methanobacterium sp.]